MNTTKDDKYIIYKKGYKYQTVISISYHSQVFPEKDIFTSYIHLHKSGLLWIKSGYAWNGASGPTIDTKNFMRGPLVHDALYQFIRMGHLDIEWREQADRELYKICIEDGMCPLRAWYVYQSVKRFAKFAALPKNRKPLITAPKQ